MGKIKSPLSIFVGIFCLGSVSSFGQGTLQITFDGPPAQPSGTQFGATSYSEAGMLFTPIDTTTPGSQLTRNGGGIAGYPDDGSAYMQEGGGLLFSFTDGSVFGLKSVDLAGYSTAVPDYSVEFEGFLAGGGTITTTFSGTGINFQTVQFGSQWNGLTSVEVVDSPWSLDNLVVTVPEPSGFALTMLGAAFFCRRFRPIGIRNKR